MPEALVLTDDVRFLLRLAYMAAIQSVPDTRTGDPRNFAALAALADEQPLSQRQLATRLGINRTTTRAVADGLVNRALVVRERDRNDGRAYSMVLTPAGADALGQMEHTMDSSEALFTRELGPSERARLRLLLRTLLEGAGGTPPALRDRAGLLVHRAFVVARGEADLAFSGLGIEVRHYGLMTVVRRLGEPTQQDVARELVVSAPVVGEVVEELELRGLLARGRSTKDRRVQLPRLTDKGTRTLDEADALASELPRSLSPTQRVELRDLLCRLLALGPAPEPDPALPAS